MSINDPGAKPLGNFPFYYQFNPVSERLEKIDDDVLNMMTKHYQERTNQQDEPFCLLDIGCNTGSPVHTLGVDIDKDLIQRAKKQILDADTRLVDDEIPKIIFSTLDATSSDDLIGECCRFLTKRGQCRFALTCLFSITMWIHVNIGDDGFLRTLSDICSVSGKVLLPQNFGAHGWLSLERRFVNLFLANLTESFIRRLCRNGVALPPHIDSLKLRGPLLFPSIQACIKDNGFVLARELGTTSWKRPLWLFVRNDSIESA
eukprot:gene44-3440_t